MTLEGRCGSAVLLLMDLDPAIVKQLALGIVPPGLAGTALFAMTLRKRDAETPTAGWLPRLAPLLLAALYCGAHALVLGLRVPPRESTDWLPIAALLTGVAATFLGRGERGRAALLAGGFLRLFVLAGVGVLAAGRIRANWSAEEAAMQIGGFVLAAAVAMLSTEIVIRRRNAALAALVLLAFAAGASQVLVLGFSSLKLSQSAGLWAAMLGGAVLVGLFRRGSTLPLGIALVVVALTIAAMFQGALYTSTKQPWLLIALVAASPAMAMAGSLLPFPVEGRIRHLRWIVPLVCSLLPIGAAIALSMPNDSAGSDETEYDYEY
jgi:hypothetical protein